MGQPRGGRPALVRLLKAARPETGVMSSGAAKLKYAGTNGRLAMPVTAYRSLHNAASANWLAWLLAACVECICSQASIW